MVPVADGSGSQLVLVMEKMHRRGDMGKVSNEKEITVQSSNDVHIDCLWRMLSSFNWFDLKRGCQGWWELKVPERSNVVMW